MARYIDAEKLCKGLKEMASVQHLDKQNTILAVVSTIENTSTADVEEIRHGEWMLMGTEMFMDGSHSSKFCCSLCSREIGVCHEHDSDKYRYAKVMYPYCHCGARMDGGKNENV